MEAPSTSVVHSELTYNEFVQHICAFLQVAFETLLCVRNVYPPEVFQRRKKYNTPVYQVRHPGLANYVGLIIKSIKVELLKATIERVVLVITDTADSTPLERFVFHLDYMIDVPPTRDRDLIIEQAPTLHMLELFLRSFMLKLMLVEASLAPLPHPENTTFAVLLEFKDGHRPRSDDKNVSDADQPQNPILTHSVNLQLCRSQKKGRGCLPTTTPPQPHQTRPQGKGKAAHAMPKARTTPTSSEPGPNSCPSRRSTRASSTSCSTSKTTFRPRRPSQPPCHRPKPTTGRVVGIAQASRLRPDSEWAVRKTKMDRWRADMG